MRLEVCKRL